MNIKIGNQYKQLKVTHRVKTPTINIKSNFIKPVNKICIKNKNINNYLDNHGFISSKRHRNEYNLIKKFDNNICDLPELKIKDTKLCKLVDAYENLKHYSLQNYVSAEGLNKGCLKLINTISLLIDDSELTEKNKKELNDYRNKIIKIIIP